MSATRDPDLLLHPFLDEGPAVLPDRALEAVRRTSIDIDSGPHSVRGDSRTCVLSWRRPRSLRSSSPARASSWRAALLAPGNKPTPSPSITALSSVTALPVVDGALHAGVTYDSGTFTHAFAFTAPA